MQKAYTCKWNANIIRICLSFMKLEMQIQCTIDYGCPIHVQRKEAKTKNNSNNNNDNGQPNSDAYI